MRISKSKLNLYLQCPRKFKYRYIDHLEEETGDFAQLGLDVHKYAEDIGNELMNCDVVTNAILKDIMLKLYPFDEEDFEGDQHAQALLNFFENVFDNNYEIFSVEGDIYYEELNLRGIVDLILKDKDTNELIIIDYKTGKARSVKDYRIELCMYKRLVNYKYSDYVVSAACIYFTKDQNYRGFNFVESQKKGTHVTQEDYESVFDLIDFVRQQIQEEYFPPKFDPYFACKYCSFVDQCKEDGGR